MKLYTTIYVVCLRLLVSIFPFVWDESSLAAMRKQYFRNAFR